MLKVKCVFIFKDYCERRMLVMHIFYSVIKTVLMGCIVCCSFFWM